eukprot:559289-Pyramimonas_sp.AAC.1
MEGKMRPSVWVGVAWWVTSVARDPPSSSRLRAGGGLGKSDIAGAGPDGERGMAETHAAQAAATAPRSATLGAPLGPHK